MRTLFLPSLIDSPGGDPGLYVDLMDEGRAVLLDLGEIAHVAPRKLLRVDHAVVTHLHMDHFVGFDHLLRLALRRDRPLTVTGPEGFLDAARGRIGAYAWNLVEGYPVRLRIQEVAGTVIRTETYTGASRMRPVPEADRPFHGVVHAERLFTLEVGVLDHGIPVLAAALREVEHLGVDRDRLEKMGLAAGEWLRDFKQAVRRGDPEDAPVEAASAGGRFLTFRLGELAEEILRRGEGQRLAYVTDLAHTPQNAAFAARLAAGADLLVCEAAFLDEDRDLAEERRHLTARQAGTLAREAGAKRLAIFHQSPRYEGRMQALFEEAAEAFGGPMVALPSERDRG